MDLNENMMEYYGLSEDELTIAMSSFMPEKLQAKQYYLKEGEISDKIGFVKSGLLRAFFYNDNADEITTDFYPSGSLIISFDSFNNQTPSKENIVAVDDAELLVITYQKQQQLYQKVPVWNQMCRDIADKKSEDSKNRAVQMQTLTAKERYQQFCKDYPEVIQKCPLRHIASYLGIDNATLSRIRRKI